MTDDTQRLRLRVENAIHEYLYRVLEGSAPDPRFVEQEVWPFIEARCRLLEAERDKARAEALEQAAKAIEADPGEHYVRTVSVCAQFEDDDGNVEPTGCGKDRCSGHPDGHSVVHGPAYFAALVRGVSVPETP